jgi:hypothetical protein
VLCDWYLSVIRPYLYSLLPENMIKPGRFIVDTLENNCVSLWLFLFTWEGSLRRNKEGWWNGTALKHVYLALFWLSARYQLLWCVAMESFREYEDSVFEQTIIIILQDTKALTINEYLSIPPSSTAYKLNLCSWNNVAKIYKCQANP